MLAAIVGCFWGGIKAAYPHSKQDFFSALSILGFLYIFALPLFFFALFSGCLTFDGFAFWLLTPLPSVFLGTAIGRLFRKLSLPFPKSLTILTLLFIAIGVWLFEFFHFPQVYFYNHVWGFWPGPIYDEAVPLSGAYLYFRWLTFLWILALWMIPSWSKTRQTKLLTFLALFSLLLSYLNLNEAGIIHPGEVIQSELAGQFNTEHFHLFYDSTLYSDQEIQYWAARHEFYFQQITQQLEVDWPKGRIIESYLYGNAWQKKKITGAKFTSYVPIWLEQDQLHIAKQQLEGVLKHEMVHVISKRFGNALFHGSRSIGLIEGLAEGIAKDASPRSTLHQIVAAERPLPSAGQLQSAFSIFGFYGSAGSISYTTTGSFVAFLLENYPPSLIKKAYPTGDIQEAYKQPFDSLVANWHQELNATPLDSVDRQISEYVFAQRSLFQKKCPHSVTQQMRLWDDYQFLLAREDTLKADQKLDRLFALNSENALIKDAWIRSQLLRGHYQQAAEAITKQDTLLTLQVLKSDALFLAGKPQKARRLLSTLTPRIQSSQNRTFTYTLSLREDSLQWSYHVNRRYHKTWPDSAGFYALNTANQMLTLNKSLSENRPQQVVQFMTILLGKKLNTHWFDSYDSAIKQLVFSNKFGLAQQWIQKVAQLPLRLRYQQRLDELLEWHHFFQQYKAVAD